MTARIPLLGKNGEPRAYALLDDADAERLGHYRWYLLTRTSKYRVVNYVARGESREGRRYTVYLHREILGLSLPWEAQDGLEPDHINGDGLDNRRTNLRTLTHAENMQNRRRNAIASSRFRGVFWNPRLQKWGAKVVVRGRTHYLGLFPTEREAATAASDARARLMPFSPDAALAVAA